MFRMHLISLYCLTSACTSLALQNTQSVFQEPTPLARAHAHNDYRHHRPLLDALAHGFTSVEADVFLVDDQLLVAHGRCTRK